MRDYGKIHPEFWTGKTGKLIKRQGGPLASMLAMYLLTSPHSNMIGVYYLPLGYAAVDTGMGLPEVESSLRVCVESGFCDYDPETEIVWVKNMATYQIAQALKPQDNRVKNILELLTGLPENPFTTPFYETYKEAFHLSMNPCMNGQCDRPVESCDADHAKGDVDNLAQSIGQCDRPDALANGDVNINKASFNGLTHEGGTQGGCEGGTQGGCEAPSKPENREQGTENREQGEEQEQEPREKKPRAPSRPSKPLALIADDWQPSEKCWQIIDDHGIDRTFARMQVNEFVFYWQDRGDKRAGWDATFIGRVKTEWERRSQGPPRRAGGNGKLTCEEINTAACDSLMKKILEEDRVIEH